MKQLLIADDVGTPVYSDQEEGQILCPLIGTFQSMLRQSFNQSARSVRFGRSLFVLQTHHGLHFAAISDQGEPAVELDCELQLVHDLLSLVIGGPSRRLGGTGATVSSTSRVTWQSRRQQAGFTRLVDTALALCSTHQSVLVRALEMLEVNEDIRAACVARLREALSALPELRCAALFVGSRLLAQYSPGSGMGGGMGQGSPHGARRSSRGPAASAQFPTQELLLLMVHMMSLFRPAARAGAAQAGQQAQASGQQAQRATACSSASSPSPSPSPSVSRTCVEAVSVPVPCPAGLATSGSGSPSYATSFTPPTPVAMALSRRGGGGSGELVAEGGTPVSSVSADSAAVSSSPPVPITTSSTPPFAANVASPVTPLGYGRSVSACSPSKSPNTPQRRRPRVSAMPPSAATIMRAAAAATRASADVARAAAHDLATADSEPAMLDGQSWPPPGAYLHTLYLVGGVAHAVYSAELLPGIYLVVASKESQRKFPEQRSILTLAHVALRDWLAQDYAPFLLTKERAHMPMISYLPQVPGLVQFIFVDRGRNLVVAPSVAPLYGQESAPSHSSASLRRLVWKLVQLGHHTLARGCTTSIMRCGGFQYSHRLWSEGPGGEQSISVERALGRNCKQLPCIVSPQLYADIVQQQQQSQQRSGGPPRCYELYSIYVGCTPLSAIPRKDRQLLQAMSNLTGYNFP